MGAAAMFWVSSWEAGGVADWSDIVWEMVVRRWSRRRFGALKNGGKVDEKVSEKRRVKLHPKTGVGAMGFWWKSEEKWGWVLGWDLGWFLGWGLIEGTRKGGGAEGGGERLTQRRRRGWEKAMRSGLPN